MSRSPALDPSEEQLLSDVEFGAMHSVATGELLSQLQYAARRTGSKDQRINIRLSSADLQGLRTRALKEGIPYQNHPDKWGAQPLCRAGMDQARALQGQVAMPNENGHALRQGREGETERDAMTK